MKQKMQPHPLRMCKAITMCSRLVQPLKDDKLDKEMLWFWIYFYRDSMGMVKNRFSIGPPP